MVDARILDAIKDDETETTTETNETPVEQTNTEPKEEGRKRTTPRSIGKTG